MRSLLTKSIIEVLTNIPLFLYFFLYSRSSLIFNDIGSIGFTATDFFTIFTILMRGADSYRVLLGSKKFSFDLCEVMRAVFGRLCDGLNIF
jgi:hypothetical protein